jgi:hypothetical protein
MPWNVVAQVGNPTRLLEVNALIKAVKKRNFEGRGNHHRQTGHLRRKSATR